MDSEARQMVIKSTNYNDPDKAPILILTDVPSDALTVEVVTANGRGTLRFQYDPKYTSTSVAFGELFDFLREIAARQTADALGDGDSNG